MTKLIRFVFLFVLMVFAATFAKAQDASNLYLAGGSYSHGASPAFDGSAFYGHKLTDGTIGFTLLDVLPNSTKPFTVNTNIGVGVAKRVTTIAGLPIFVPASISITYNSANVAWAYSTGFGVPIKYKPWRGGNFYFMPNLRVSKSSLGDFQPIFGLMAGWGS